MRCRVRAEGRPFEALYGGDVPNHRVLRWLKTVSTEPSAGGCDGPATSPLVS